MRPDGAVGADAFDAAPVPAVVLDASARVVLWNERAARAATGDLDGAHVGRLLDGEGTVVDRTLARALDGGDARTRVRLRDGGPARLALRKTPEDGPGAAVGVAWPVTDETDRVARLERTLQTVAHDVRSPLTVASGAVEAARETGDAERLVAAERALDRIGDIVDEGAALARPGEERRTTADVGTVATQAWHAVDSRDARLVIEDPGCVEAGDGRLRRLFENLLRNCVEHGAADDRDDGLTVRVGPVDSGGFYVVDDGAGFDAAARDRLFEAGYTGPNGGTGLGLAIVASVADEHDWTVRATESAAGGARVEVHVDESAG
jgi:signal transduction histidine kinase